MASIRGGQGDSKKSCYLISCNQYSCNGSGVSEISVD